MYNTWYLFPFSFPFWVFFLWYMRVASMRRTKGSRHATSTRGSPPISADGPTDHVHLLLHLPFCRRWTWWRRMMEQQWTTMMMMMVEQQPWLLLTTPKRNPPCPSTKSSSHLCARLLESLPSTTGFSFTYLGVKTETNMHWQNMKKQDFVRNVTGHNRLTHVYMRVQRLRITWYRQKTENTNTQYFNVEKPKQEKTTGVHKPQEIESLWWGEYNKMLRGNDLETFIWPTTVELLTLHPHFLPLEATTFTLIIHLCWFPHI